MERRGWLAHYFAAANSKVLIPFVFYPEPQPAASALQTSATPRGETLFQVLETQKSLKITACYHSWPKIMSDLILGGVSRLRVVDVTFSDSLHNVMGAESDPCQQVFDGLSIIQTKRVPPPPLKLMKLQVPSSTRTLFSSREKHRPTADSSLHHGCQGCHGFLLQSKMAERRHKKVNEIDLSGTRVRSSWTIHSVRSAQRKTTRVSPSAYNYQRARRPCSRAAALRKAKC